ncbi:MAG: DUF4474 domain-containing protein [Oscillospiraceae bacterium]|jgi:hypothetical protein|nr:DUF4474 domain-containing protein [Oscillospiraceae bacterium]
MSKEVVFLGLFRALISLLLAGFMALYGWISPPHAEEAAARTEDLLLEAADQAELLSYKYHPDGYFYIEDNPWQRGLGFNQAYDELSHFATCFYDTIRVKFRYGHKDWLIQLWKGSYGIVFAGGEIGIYNKPAAQALEHYTSASDAERLGMDLTVWNDGRRLFTRPFGQYWWITGFNFGWVDGLFQSPRSDVVLKTTLEFPTEDMRQLFTDELDRKGFVPLDAGEDETPPSLGLETPEQYFAAGQRVTLVWQYLDETSW